jgi:preprotein translocase subunit SecF
VLAALRADQRDVDVVRIEVIEPQVGKETLTLGSVVGSITVIVACVGIMIYLAVRLGWRSAVAVTVTNVRNMVIVLALFLVAFAVFQWEFSILILMAMVCLGIGPPVFGAVRALRAPANATNEPRHKIESQSP